MFDNKILMVFFRAFLALYNVFVLWIFQYFIESQLVGSVLFTLAIINIFSILSRLGADFYWVKSLDKKLVVSNKEFAYNAAFSAFFSVIIYLLLNENEISSLISIGYIVVTANVIQLVGRFLQKIECHILSLSVFIFSPYGFTLIILTVLPDLSVLESIMISNSFILILLFPFFFNKIEFNVVDERFSERLNFLPMIMFGALNQNIIALYGGAFNHKESVGALVLLQRSCGLVAWPLTFFMQKDLVKIKSYLIGKKEFLNGLKHYVIDNLLILASLSIMSFILGLFSLYNSELWRVDSVFALCMILIASIINGCFGFVQYQLASSNLGWIIIGVFLFASLAPSLLFIGIDSFYISGSLSYLFFHLFVHSINIFIMYKRIR